MLIAHISDLHVMAPGGVDPRRLFNKRLTGYANLRLKRHHSHKLEVLERVCDAVRELKPDHVIVSGDLVADGKPAPDCYLLAAQHLGVDPRDSVAIEDSEYGVAAAVAAGMATIAVPLHVPIPESPAYTRWPDLAGSTPAALAEVLAAHRAGAAR